MKIFEMLKTGTKYERAESYSIVILLAGTLILSTGIGLTVINPKGISAILAMLGSLITFLSTITLIFIWLTKEFIGE